jgi:hypothetical protein
MFITESILSVLVSGNCPLYLALYSKPPVTLERQVEYHNVEPNKAEQSILYH